MKACHIATFALVGWYLMAPPLDSPNGALNTSANYPLSEWIHEPHEVFDTQRDCEAELANRRASAETAARQTGAARTFSERDLSSSAKLYVERMRVAQCVATDDPRLKEK